MKDTCCKSAFGSARYIKAQNSAPEYSLYDPAPLFRKEFTVDATGDARIFVQSPGFARYYINGRDITDDLFISAVSDYTKLLWYNEYDVTHLLQKGKNVVCVIAGNGFLNESFDSAWHYPDAAWRDAPQFLLHLTVDGKTAVVSDGSWKCSRERSHIIYNHLRSGEYWDMRKKDDSWMQVGYDDFDWQYAIEREGDITGKLRLTPCQSVREAERVAPTAITETERGYLVDFGVTMSGYLEVTLTEERGREIQFRYTEDIDEQGAPKYNKMDAPGFYPESPFHLNKMTASGARDTFKPLFCYHGFRYVLIEGLSKAPSPSALCACFIHQDVERRSTFDSGSDILNFIYNAGIRSTYSNMFWSLTDCPTREKLGWANDAQNSVEQTLINFDILPLYNKWFEDVKSCMREDGAMPGIIPSPDWGFEWGPVCDLMLYEIPYRIYLYTGQTRMLTEAIPYFERYANYLTKEVDSDREFRLGDWLGYKSSPLVPKELVRDAYLIKALTVTDFAHRMAKTGNTEWAARLAARKSKFTGQYIEPSGKCTVNSQCALSMVIMLGLYRDKQTVADQLVSCVIADELTLTCGMVGIQYIYDALAECGRADLAYKMLTGSEPGYKTWYDSGATTLWERWDGANSGSHNHHMYSGIIAWFYKRLLGIAPTEGQPAFAELELRPCFVKEAGFVKGQMQTVCGKIEAQWRYTGVGFAYTVTLPRGIRASFRGAALSEGVNEFFVEEAL